MPTPNRPAYAVVNLDLFVYIINTSILHPFVAWMVPLCLRAVAMPYSAPSFQVSTAWASFLTVLFVAREINRRVAHGVPRDVNWEDEVVVVTGGASGLGLILAETYGMRGASVAVLDINELENAEDRGISWYKCDVGVKEEVERTAKLIQAEVSKKLSW